MREINPSKMSPWEGAPVAGSRYTVQQLHVMKQERPNWSRFSDHMVKLTYPAPSGWGMPREAMVPCPIIAWTKDRTRVLIIAPAGDKMWMLADRKAA